MKYQEALKIIKEKYEVSIIDEDMTQIIINKLLNPFNFYFICIFNCGDSTLITDMSETSDIISDVSESYWLEKCHKYNAKFDNWRLIKNFNSIEDLKEFIKLLDEVSDENFKRNYKD